MGMCLNILAKRCLFFRQVTFGFTRIVMNADSCNGSHVDIFTVSRHDSPAATPTAEDPCQLPPAYSSLTFDLDPPPYSAVVSVPITTRLPLLSSSNSSSRTPSPGVHDTPHPQLLASQVTLDFQRRRHASNQQRSDSCHSCDGQGHRVCSCCPWLYCLIIGTLFLVLLIVNFPFAFVFFVLQGKLIWSRLVAFSCFYLHIDFVGRSCKRVYFFRMSSVLKCLSR
jgi:hypothetical protein